MVRSLLSRKSELFCTHFLWEDQIVFLIVIGHALTGIFYYSHSIITLQRIPGRGTLYIATLSAALNRIDAWIQEFTIWAPVGVVRGRNQQQ